MKKLLKTFMLAAVFALFISVEAHANIEGVLNEVGGTFETVGSFTYNTLFAIIAIMIAVIAGGMFILGKIDLQRMLMMMAIAVMVAVSLGFFNYVMKPQITDMAKEVTSVQVGW
tara:strand:- start:20895 stop:21236 length:342 start_codon:yes stop_codon:yes gene_type:complete